MMVHSGVHVVQAVNKHAGKSLPATADALSAAASCAIRPNSALAAPLAGQEGGVSNRAEFRRGRDVTPGELGQEGKTCR
jgi:hypothetical protein